MRLVEVLIRRSERESIPRSVPSWEVPLLQLVHSPEAVEKVREFSDERDYPAPEVEFDRLVRRYGNRKPDETPFAEIQYGPGFKGVSELTRAIDEERRAGSETEIEDSTN